VNLGLALAAGAAVINAVVLAVRCADVDLIFVTETEGEPDGVLLIATDGPTVTLSVFVAESVPEPEFVVVPVSVLVLNRVTLIVFETRIVFVSNGDLDDVDEAVVDFEPRTEFVGEGAAVAVLDARPEVDSVLLCLGVPETLVLPVIVRVAGRDFDELVDAVLLFVFICDDVTMRVPIIDCEPRAEALTESDAVVVFEIAEE